MRCFLFLQGTVPTCVFVSSQESRAKRQEGFVPVSFVRTWCWDWELGMNGDVHGREPGGEMFLIITDLRWMHSTSGGVTSKLDGTALRILGITIVPNL